MKIKREIRIGLVELRPLDKKAYGAAGSFTNIVTWASNPAEFRKKAETIASTMDLFVLDIEDAEPYLNRNRPHEVSEEIEEIASRAESNPNAIIYGTFHRYSRDGA
jgi:hypothetical protein